MADIYTTPEKVKHEAGFQNNANIVDADDVQPHLDSAEAEVNAAIGCRYVLPLSDNALWTGSVSENLVIGIATRLGAAFMMLQQFEGQGAFMSAEAIKKRDDARKQLEMIAKGTIKLFDTAGEQLTVVASALKTLVGFPDNTADTTAPRKFTTEQVF